jgi:hypothetical protein
MGFLGEFTSPSPTKGSERPSIDAFEDSKDELLARRGESFKNSEL